jgi:hypothetical protein
MGDELRISYDTGVAGYSHMLRYVIDDNAGLLGASGWEWMLG